jgi:hypothetical protein
MFSAQDHYPDLLGDIPMQGAGMLFFATRITGAFAE